MRNHTVNLPQPHRSEVRTTATCACGEWSVTYVWGGHQNAADDAAAHIQEAAQAQPFQVESMSGQITVMEGRSL